MKVLMISPNMSDPKNGGVGLVSQRLSAILSDEVSLTIIQPEDISEKSKKKTSETFSESALIKDITKNVASKIYVYENERAVEITEEQSTLRSELQNFTTGVLEASEELDTDVIYAHDWVSFNAALQVKERIKKPLILHVHSLDVDRISSINHSWVYDIEKSAFEQADMIITVSNYAASRISKYYDIHPRKITVIYNGVDQPEPVEHTKRFDEPVVLFAGRLNSQKGVKNFVKIAEKILDDRPDVRFVMAGEGDMKKDLMETAAHKKIGDRIHFTGHLDRLELSKAFSEATAFCLPSVSEPFGLAAMEAAAANVPVIISKQSGAVEVLPSALSFDHSDIDAFASSILGVLSNKTYTPRMIAENNKAAQSLSWTKTAKEVLNVFNSFS